jgi:hypothetical protein
MKQSNQLNLNLSDELRRVLDEIEARTGLKDQAVARALFRALGEYWNERKRLTLPFILTGEDETKPPAKTRK